MFSKAKCSVSTLRQPPRLLHKPQLTALVCHQLEDVSDLGDHGIPACILDRVHGAQDTSGGCNTETTFSMLMHMTRLIESLMSE